MGTATKDGRNLLCQPGQSAARCNFSKTCSMSDSPTWAFCQSPYHAILQPEFFDGFLQYAHRQLTEQKPG
jgi:hypothetical protein